MSTYDYSSYNSYAGTAGAILGGMFIVFGLMILIALIFVILAVIGQWKAFKKAGKGGWEAIVPIYAQVVNCQIVGVNPWWILIVYVGSIVLSIIPVIGQLASLALLIYFAILLYVSTARSFGKSDGFAVGLYFLGPIFWLILGGKNTQYLGPKPMNDVVMNFVKEKTGNNNATQANMNNNFNQNQAPMNNMGQQMNAQPMNNVSQPVNAQPINQAQPAVKFCTGCGYKISNGERFCPGCGKEVQ